MSESLMLLAAILAAILAGCHAFLDSPDSATLQQDMRALQAKVARLESILHSLHQQLNATSDLAAVAAAKPHHAPVAFTAHLLTTITSLPEHHHVAFDDVITNLGDAYNKVTGHFRAPVFGVYGFFLTATNVPGHSVSLSLMLSGRPVAYTLAHGTAQTPTQFETSSTGIVLNLKAGDEVWAQNENKFSTVEELDGWDYSTFTGFLITAM